MKTGMSVEEREAYRQRIRDAAIARAELTNMTIRCRDLQHNLDDPGHQWCRGEERGNCGCLCRCHDRRARATILSRQDQRASA